MKKTFLLTLAVAPMILGAPLASMAESVTTDPVGFVKLNLEPGLQSVGVAMLHPAVAAGAVASNSENSITLVGDHSIALDVNTAYYVEVASGLIWEGERFEVDVAGSSNSTIAIADSSRNTVSLSAVDLSDHSIRIRPHRTLADVFDVDQLKAGSTAANSDSVLFLNEAGAFDVFFLEEDIFGGDPVWRQLGVAGNFGNRILEPGLGMLFRRNDTSAVELLTNIGEVRTNNFRQPLKTGLTHIAEGHPVDNSPDSRMMTEANGFVAGSTAGNSDNILVLNPAGSFDVFFLEEDIFGGDPVWRQLGTAGNFNSAALMAADGSVLVRKLSADLLYEAPKNF